MKVYKKDGSEVNIAEKEYVDNKVVVIDCNLIYNEYIIDNRLANAKKVECQFTNSNGNWNLIVTSFGGYALNTYKEYSCGVYFYPTINKLNYQFSSHTSLFTLTKIIATF